MASLLSSGSAAVVSVGADLSELSYRGGAAAPGRDSNPPTSRLAPGALPRTAPVRPAAGSDGAAAVVVAGRPGYGSATELPEHDEAPSGIRTRDLVDAYR